MLVIVEDIEGLINKCNDLLHYHDRFEKYIILDDEIPALKEKNPETRRTVTILDYLLLLVEVDMCIKKIEGYNGCHDDFLVILKDIKFRLKAIVDDKVTIDKVLRDFVDLIEVYEENIIEIDEYDTYFFEFACRNRESIQEIIYYIEEIKRLNVDAVIPNFYIEKMNDFDKGLLAKIDEMNKSFPNIERPFPNCPSYFPDNYWWYLK